jgi:hypothetical protein
MAKAIFCCLVVKRTWKSTLWCGRSKLHWGQWRWSRLNSWDFPQTWQSITPPGVLSHSLTVCSVLRQRTMDIFLSNTQAIARKWKLFSIAYLSFSHHPCGHILQRVEVDPSILLCQVVWLKYFYSNVWVNIWDFVRWTQSFQQISLRKCLLLQWRAPKP